MGSVERLFLVDTVEKLGNLAVFMNREDISLSDFLYLPKAAGKYGLNG